MPGLPQHHTQGRPIAPHRAAAAASHSRAGPAAHRRAAAPSPPRSALRWCWPLARCDEPRAQRGSRAGLVQQTQAQRGWGRRAAGTRQECRGDGVPASSGGRWLPCLLTPVLSLYQRLNLFQRDDLAGSLLQHSLALVPLSAERGSRALARQAASAGTPALPGSPWQRGPHLAFSQHHRQRACRKPANSPETHAPHSSIHHPRAASMHRRSALQASVAPPRADPGPPATPCRHPLPPALHHPQVVVLHRRLCLVADGQRVGHHKHGALGQHHIAGAHLGRARAQAAAQHEGAGGLTLAEQCAASAPPTHHTHTLIPTHTHTPPPPSSKRKPQPASAAASHSCSRSQPQAQAQAQAGPGRRRPPG